MAVHIAIECRGGPQDGFLVLIDQHADPEGVKTFRSAHFEYFYELHEKQRPSGNWDIWYEYSLAMRLKRYDQPDCHFSADQFVDLQPPSQDDWPEPPIDEAY